MINELNILWVWAIYRMILTGETGVIGEKPATLSFANFIWTALGSNPGRSDLTPY
jgi:hypothetical protein